MRSSWVPYSRLCSLNVIDFHYVSCREFKLLLFNCSCSWNVVYVLLISNEFCGFWFEISNALKIVTWVERVLWRPNGLELNALWLSPFNIFASESIFNFVETYVQVPGNRSLNVVIWEVPLLLIGIDGLRSVKFGDSSCIQSLEQLLRNLPWMSLVVRFKLSDLPELNFTVVVFIPSNFWIVERLIKSERFGIGKLKGSFFDETVLPRCAYSLPNCILFYIYWL
jgi:hypothetical protein